MNPPSKVRLFSDAMDLVALDRGEVLAKETNGSNGKVATISILNFHLQFLAGHAEAYRMMLRDAEDFLPKSHSAIGNDCIA